MPILQNSPPVHQELTKAIADAEHRGDNAEVDALLMAKTILIRREVIAVRAPRVDQVPHRDPEGAHVAEGFCERRQQGGAS